MAVFCIVDIFIVAISIRI